MELQSPTDVPANALTVVKQRMRLRLENERERVVREIGAYPTPIPRCDAQFNYLIEQRDSIARSLQRLDETAVEPTTEAMRKLEALIDESCLSESLKEELRSIVAQVEPTSA